MEFSFTTRHIPSTHDALGHRVLRCAHTHAPSHSMHSLVPCALLLTTRHIPSTHDALGHRVLRSRRVTRTWFSPRTAISSAPARAHPCSHSRSVWDIPIGMLINVYSLLKSTLGRCPFRRQLYPSPGWSGTRTATGAVRQHETRRRSAYRCSNCCHCSMTGTPCFLGSVSWAGMMSKIASVAPLLSVSLSLLVVVARFEGLSVA